MAVRSKGPAKIGRLTWPAVALLGVAAAASFYWMEVRAEQLKGPDATVPLSYFGQHIHRADRGTAWPSVRFGVWRLWDADVTWPYLEPQRGKWDYARLDAYLEMAERHGVEVLMPLGLSPAWASARPREASSYGPGQAAEPKNLDDWKTYVRTVATRYKGRIKTYEVWNEVNEPGFYTGSTLALVELAREAHAILKEIDPEIRVVSPSFVGGVKHVPAQFEDYLKAGGGKYADVIGYHFYVPSAHPETMLGLVRIVKDKLAQHGLSDKPLWNTEAGWWIENGDGHVPPIKMDPHWRSLGQEHATAYVMRAMLLGWTAGLQRYYWYAWDNEAMGLVEPKARRPKDAARAYDALVRWLEGRRVSACLQQRGVWRCEVTPAAGAASHVVWVEDDKPREWSVPAELPVTRITDHLGNVKDIPASRSIRIGGIPQLLSPAGKD